MDGNRAGFGDKYKTFDSDYIADVKMLFEESVIKTFIFPRTKVVAGDIYLYAASGVLKFDKGSASHNPTAHHPSCDAYRLELIRLAFEVIGDRFCGRVDFVGFCWKWVDTKVNNRF